MDSVTCVAFVHDAVICRGTALCGKYEPMRSLWTLQNPRRFVTLLLLTTTSVFPHVLLHQATQCPLTGPNLCTVSVEIHFGRCKWKQSRSELSEIVKWHQKATNSQFLNPKLFRFKTCSPYLTLVCTMLAFCLIEMTKIQRFNLFRLVQKINFSQIYVRSFKSTVLDHRIKNYSAPQWNSAVVILEGNCFLRCDAYFFALFLLHVGLHVHQQERTQQLCKCVLVLSPGLDCRWRTPGEGSENWGTHRKTGLVMSSSPHWCGWLLGRRIWCHIEDIKPPAV